MGESGRGGSVDHCLALKVMRLTRPSLGQSTVLQTSSLDLGSELLDQHQARDVNTSPGLASLSPGCLLVLPQSFGNIYLGETFTSYVCVHNDSTEVCSSVSVRSEKSVVQCCSARNPRNDNAMFLLFNCESSSSTIYQINFVCLCVCVCTKLKFIF